MSNNVFAEAEALSRADRERIYRQKAQTFWFTGLSGSGKSTVAKAVESELVKSGRTCVWLDGDNMRLGLCKGLSFSDEDRRENLRRVAEVSKLLNDSGIIVFASFVSPQKAYRLMAREIIGPKSFTLVWVNTPLDVCRKRDPKGLYKKAQCGEIKDFTGVGQNYEPPLDHDIEINGESWELKALVNDFKCRTELA